jgi:hypothetical protein
LEPYGSDGLYIDCEILENNELLTRRRSEELFPLVKGKKIVVFDEAQTVRGIGSALKTLYDHHPEVQYVATGSSSFDLANIVSEPLTGRSREFILYPLGLDEMVRNSFEYEHKLAQYMRFGGFPGIQGTDDASKEYDLRSIVTQYLFKNVLSLDGVRRPELLTKLLQLLAHQIGNEVSYRELSNTLNTSIATVEKYIQLLELNFIIVRLPSYSTNQRSEIGRGKKIYFTDLGLRNALIESFTPVTIISRADVGMLFENAMIIERLKYLSHTHAIMPRQYFWRTFSQHEVDYIEWRGDGSRAYEFKWNTDKDVRIPKQFKALYPQIPATGVTPRNAYAFVTGTLAEK